MTYKATYFKKLARYDLCSNRKEWCLELITSGGTFSEFFDEGDEPEIDDLLPSEVMNLIEARLDSYLISGVRKETKARIAIWRESEKGFDHAWLDAKITSAENTLNSLRERREAIW